MSTKSVIVAVLLIGLGIVFGVVLVSSFKGVDVSFAGADVAIGSSEERLKPDPSLIALNGAMHDISKAVTPAVVYIETKSTVKPNEQGDEGWFHRFFGPDFEMPREERGAGSGVILSSDGYILTNNHVVADADDDGIEVILFDNRRFTDAVVVGRDEYTDLAVIKIGAENLAVPRIGNSDEVEVGHVVFAIGNPLGLTSTMTQGIVSALGRQLRIVAGQSPYGIENFIQTDAAVNPGNSGGALVNIYGEVIGINTAIATTNQRFQGYSFAIPSNLAKKVANDIIKYGSVRRGYIGVSIQTVDARTAKAVGFDKPKGVFVQEVNPGSGGEDAGLQSGDIILSVDGREVNTANELQTIVGGKSPGDVVTLSVFRTESKKTITKKVTLKARPDEGESAVRAREGTESPKPKEKPKVETVDVKDLGLRLRDVDGNLEKTYEVKGGAYVESVEPGSEAFMRGLAKKDIIVGVGDQNVESAQDFAKVIAQMKTGDAVLLRVKTEEKRTRYIAIEIPKR